MGTVEVAPCVENGVDMIQRLSSSARSQVSGLEICHQRRARRGRGSGGATAGPNEAGPDNGAGCGASGCYVETIDGGTAGWRHPPDSPAETEDG